MDEINKKVENKESETKETKETKEIKEIKRTINMKKMVLNNILVILDSFDN
jgi:hypothetical protein